MGLKAKRVAWVWRWYGISVTWALVSPEEIAQFETDVLAGFVLARASAGLG